jgi:hypothetical protein
MLIRVFTSVSIELFIIQSIGFKNARSRLLIRKQAASAYLLFGELWRVANSSSTKPSWLGVMSVVFALPIKSNRAFAVTPGLSRT